MTTSRIETEPREQSIAELTRQLSELTTRLARQEVELAKAELAAKGKTAGVGAGMFGAAAVVALGAFGASTAAAILALALALPSWLAATIVAIAYALVAGVLALRGKARMQEATPLVPEQAVESAKEDVQFAKRRVEEARQ